MVRVLVPLGRGDNPYLKLVTEHLGAGVEVAPFRAVQFFQNADVLHYHWPEHLSGNLSPLHDVWYGLRRLALSTSVNRVQSGQGALVWTAHNLAPHEPLAQHAWGADYLDRFYRRVDIAIAMSERQLPQLRDRFPMIAPDRWRIAPHPHYRTAYREWAPRKAVRAALDIPEGSFVVAMIGRIRNYKGVLEAVERFRAVARADEFLVVAGLCVDAALEAQLRDLAKDVPNLRLRLKPLRAVEYASLHKAADLALFNFSSILNSGSLLTALSLDTPVLAGATETFRELAESNPEWVDLYEGALTAERLREGIDHVRQSPPNSPPDLSAHDPSIVGQRHSDIYLEALALTRG